MRDSTDPTDSKLRNHPHRKFPQINSQYAALDKTHAPESIPNLEQAPSPRACI